MERRTSYTATTERSPVEINKVLKNTYMLLSMTLFFSAITASISMMLNVGIIGYFAMFIGAIVTMFIIHKKANSAAALPLVFLFTGLLGACLGPILSAYVAAGMSGIIAQALAGTAIIFLSLSGYALVTKKDFSFLGGFLVVGMMVVLLAILANIFFAMPAVSLAINAAIIFIMSGFILYDTSRIIHGGETNYVLATVGLYLSIYNIFTSLLSLLGAMDE